MLGLLKGAAGWVFKATGVVGKTAATGGALYVGGKALSHENGLEGFTGDVLSGLSRPQGIAGVEQTFASFYNFMKNIAIALEFLNLPFLSKPLMNFANKGLLGPEAAEQEEKNRLANKDLQSDERAHQRIYESTGLDARYRIDGPGGSPPSVEISDKPANAVNTFSLGVKGIKDGLGVAIGGVAGGIGWVADNVLQLDTFIPVGRDADGKTNWGGDMYKGVAGAVNEATDFWAYDVIGKSIGTTVGGIAGIFNGKGLIDGAVEGFQTDYEPTIRSEFDRNVYGVTSTVSGVVIGAAGGSWLTGAFALKAAGAATAAEAAAAPVTTMALGAHVMGNAAKGVATNSIATVGVVPTQNKKKVKDPVPAGP